MGKTLRFGDLVRASGRPRTVTLWMNPESDPSFSKALRQNRVLTIESEAGKKEFGKIGFHPQHGATYLLFPKSLPQQPASRVVGINYQLIDEPRPERPARTTNVRVANNIAESKPFPRRHAHAIPKPKPNVKNFEVIFRRTATLEDSRQVEAASEAEARDMVSEATKRSRFDLHRAVLKVEVLSVVERG
jgi:hypothetical protein